MATNENIEGSKEDFASGHEIQYSIRFRDFVRKLPFGFERSFQFDCKSCPTYWSFRVEFGVSPVDRSLFCTTIFKRLDEEARNLKVEFQMTLFAYPLRDIPPITFDMKDFPSKRGAKDSFYGIMQLRDREQIDDQGVLVQISLAVRGCHIDRDLRELIIRRREGKPLGPSFACDSYQKIRSKM